VVRATLYLPLCVSVSLSVGLPHGVSLIVMGAPAVVRASLYLPLGVSVSLSVGLPHGVSHCDGGAGGGACLTVSPLCVSLSVGLPHGVSHCDGGAGGGAWLTVSPSGRECLSQCGSPSRCLSV
jgi:hypothetical protein